MVLRFLVEFSILNAMTSLVHFSSPFPFFFFLKKKITCREIILSFEFFSLVIVSGNPRGVNLIISVPASFGIEIVDGVMMKFVPRNTIIPCRKFKKTLTTNQDNQTHLSIKIYGGEARLTKDCHKVGEFNLSSILPALRLLPFLVLPT